jgi:predicted aspartyl protease
MRAKLSIALSALATVMWAVPNLGAAPSFARANKGEVRSAVSAPRPVRFQLRQERGLLLQAWVNGRGPYIFALDTGAGMNVISERVLLESRLPVTNVRPTEVGGLGVATTLSNREAVISRMALGDSSNYFPPTTTALVVSTLPPDIDGILDPTETYSPYGYSIDLPNGRIEALEDNGDRIPSRRLASEGALVPWVRVGQTNRPFVRLGDGRLALVDTGSAFGLAVNERHAVIVGSGSGNANYESIRDIGGGRINARRVSPTTISIGELVLRRVPTDILFGIDDDAPVILGRDALYPFKITFDPRRRTIEFLSVPANDQS